MASELPARAPRYREHAPRPQLQRWVDAFWSLDGGDGLPRRILPDGCIDFIFDLNAGTGRVVGTMSTSLLSTVPAGGRLFGVRFAPGAAAALLEVRAHALTDRDASLPEVTNAARFALADRIAAARDHDERIAVIAAYLADAQARRRAFDLRVLRSARALRASAGGRAIADVASSVGVGERQLERLFRDHVGARPKLFARVMRMQHALAALESARTSQAAHASAAGYSDEAHMVHDWKALAGVTPGQLLAERDVGFVQDPAPAPR